jgi:hypothetical protein
MVEYMTPDDIRQFHALASPAAVKSSRLAFLTADIYGKLRQLAGDLADIDAAVAQKAPAVVIMMWHCRRIDQQVKAIRQRFGEMRAIKSGNDNTLNRRAETEIARKVPPSALMDVNNKGMAICPAHDDTRPSLLTTNGYLFCFACQWKGSVIDYVMLKNGLQFREAVKYLLALA